MPKFYDLTFSRQPDGSIRLTQSDCGEDYIIDLHPAQLRYMAESFGLVAPNYPGDELSKRLARQLCTIQRELADELWPDDTPDAQESPPVQAHVASKPTALPQTAIEAEPRNDGQQLGLAV